MGNWTRHATLCTSTVMLFCTSFCGTVHAGSFAALAPGGKVNDERASIVYHAMTGEIAVDVRSDVQLTSFGITSETHLFAEGICINGSYDNCKDILFRGAFGTSFGSFSFGEVAPPRLSETFLLSDFTAHSSLLGGGELADVDLTYIPVPEPSTFTLLGAGFAVLAIGRQRQGAVAQAPASPLEGGNDC